MVRWEEQVAWTFYNTVYTVLYHAKKQRNKVCFPCSYHIPHPLVGVLILLLLNVHVVLVTTATAAAATATATATTTTTTTTTTIYLYPRMMGKLQFTFYISRGYSLPKITIGAKKNGQTLCYIEY